MNDTSATGNYYTLGHLTLFTGLTDRTLRNYLASGILQGEKINGVWHFTPEQAHALVTHPTARAAILAKNNAITTPKSATILPKSCDHPSTHPY